MAMGHRRGRPPAAPAGPTRSTRARRRGERAPLPPTPPPLARDSAPQVPGVFDLIGTGCYGHVYTARHPAAIASMAKLHLTTYGCQMNEYDSEREAGLLRERPYELPHEAAEADV